ncbi:uncharacterized protein SPPG_07119 [Spizellomyces punctatus DAOM BR117]|uniref:G-protein coupled receptors family 3 profile domain-containing protein n=1 Tax=Spizellomyces punctatus (strain DAOM BR117) TaxID=645134 RepID=A0A0L0H802_SPIPD|nr:uncharacterized protein SPPG_07119 [Spizellomyces punctatus DAOM BR117]KNC97650.1 hypothetical protein SPPG_07119 [Spizellomyces punctatus DAOM BR117]|eukprot:XP_016605690.1 hypothetical protein SPPG_07119 [Spizellomyces punctatus DAOM BR117]
MYLPQALVFLLFHANHLIRAQSPPTIKIGVILPVDSDGWGITIKDTIHWRLDQYTNNSFARNATFELVAAVNQVGTQSAALELAYEMVYEKAVNALIGMASSPLTSLLALVAAGKRIPHCDGVSTAMSLGNKATYPTFFRTTPSDEYDAITIAQFIFAQGWRQVTILASTQEYGTSVSEELLAQCTLYGIKVLSLVLFDPDDCETEWVQTISVLKSSGATIFVYVGGGKDFMTATDEAMRQGIFSKDYVWIGAGAVMEITWSDLDTELVRLRDGTFLPFPTEYPDKALQTKLENEWAQADKVLYPASARPVVDGAGFYLDCADLLIHGWKKLIDDNPEQFNWSSIASNQLVQNYTFRCDTNNDAAVDCTPTFLINQTSVTSVMNFNPITGDRIAQYYSWYQLRGGHFNTLVGYWNNGQTVIYEDQIVYAGNSTKKPYDRHVSFIGYGTAGAWTIIATTGALLLITIATAILYFVYRSENYIRASSWMFSELILAGVAIGYASVPTFIGDPEHAGRCIGQIWMVGMAFIMVFGNLVAKTGRTWMLFQRSEAGLVPNSPITDSQLLRPAGLLIGIQILILGLWTGFDQPRQFIDFPRATRYCQSQGTTFKAVLFAYDSVIIFAGVVFALRTKEVAKKFRDSASIGLSIYTIALILCVLLPIVSLAADPVMSWVSLVVAIIICPSAILVFLFLPKIWILYQHKVRGIEPSRKRHRRFRTINAMLQTNPLGPPTNDSRVPGVRGTCDSEQKDGPLPLEVQNSESWGYADIASFFRGVFSPDVHTLTRWRSGKDVRTLNRVSVSAAAGAAVGLPGILSVRALDQEEGLPREDTLTRFKSPKDSQCVENHSERQPGKAAMCLPDIERTRPLEQEKEMSWNSMLES